jgi:hypothetical protein
MAGTADGISVPGLPGEVPDRTGDVPGGPEKADKPRGDKMLDKTMDVADDLFDSVGENVNLGAKAMQRPPTHADVPVQVHHSTSDVPHQEPDAGNLATAASALKTGWTEEQALENRCDR